MDLYTFCRELPKVELHAHLNGSLSRTTMLKLKRIYADLGLEDETNPFFDDFQIGAGDPRNLNDCFQEFRTAHLLTSTPESLAMATEMTLQEFCDDACCYIELRSTPRDTPYMTMSQYVETMVKSMQKSMKCIPLISRLIISINRSSSVSEAETITDLAIESAKKYPDVVVGIELSGDPKSGNFHIFKPSLLKAREAGLKVTLHCGEICNTQEVLEMLKFKPERIGHGTCIHPKFGGTNETWSALCESKIPVEVCLTSNINTKSIPDYKSHHFQELFAAGVPVILCTDDKGMFVTSLSQEYTICAETFALDKTEISRLASTAVQYIFSEGLKDLLKRKILNLTG